MNSLLEVLKNSTKYYLYKKSDLEEQNLTDYTSRFNSKYNFYTHLFTEISNNEVDFDLIMFWDFVGLILYKNYGFKCTSIVSLLFISVILILIRFFDFLDIDNNTHKYSFFQILFLAILYLFLWIAVGSTSLLSLQKYTDYLEILLKYLYKEKEKKQNQSKEEENKIKNENSVKEKINNNITNEMEQTFQDKPIIQDISDLKMNDIEENSNTIKSNNNSDKNECIYFVVLFITMFASFVINYIVNRKIYNYLRNYISKTLTKKNSYKKIYSKEKYLFTLCFFIPFFSEIIFSLILYCIFKSIFKKKETEEKRNMIKEKIGESKSQKEKSNENNDIIKIKEVSIKKICGYIILDQTILEFEDQPKSKVCCDSVEFFKNFCNKIKIICLILLKCLKNSYCKKDSFPCCSIPDCFGDIPFDHKKERNFYFCYQEKGKLLWLNDSLMNQTQLSVLRLAIINLYFHHITIGFEDKYDEINKNNNSPENILIPLLIAFVIYILFFTIFFFLCIKPDLKNENSHNSNFIKDNLEILLELIAFAALFIGLINCILSIVLSSIYLTNKKFNFFIKISIFINKFMVFILSFYCVKQDDNFELISNSTFDAIYLYLTDIIIYIWEKIIPLKGLIIMQIIFSSLFFIGILILIIYAGCCDKKKE